MQNQVYIIAEAGVNHNGDLVTALRLIDAAAEAGADCVKFQTFWAEEVATESAPKAEYQTQTTDKRESQYAMLKRLQLSADDHKELLRRCGERRIDFLSTATSTRGIDLLNRLGVSMYKIPSGEITNLPYLEYLGGFNRPTILSTGMATLEEVGDAIRFLCEAGLEKDNITVLHCTTEYPTPKQDVNLRAMHTIRDAYRVKVGLSDHTTGIEVAIAAVALGACVIEKHFTLDREQAGPDHAASIEPEELRQLVTTIRNIEMALGDGIKRPMPSEMKNIAIARRSLVAAMAIKKGEVFSADNVTQKRPGTGISPLRYHEVLGRRAKRNFNKDDMIEL